MRWEKAARGTYFRSFPWRLEIEPDHANFYNSHDIFDKIVGKLGDTTPVDFYTTKTYNGFQSVDSSNPSGLCDMAGNGRSMWTK